MGYVYRNNQEGVNQMCMREVSRASVTLKEYTEMTKRNRKIFRKVQSSYDTS